MSPHRLNDLDPDEDLHKKVQRAERARRLFVIAVCVFMVTTVTAVILITSKISNQQEVNAPILEEIQKLSEEIKSCTDPQGVCSKRGEKRTGEAIAALNQYGVYLEACADQPGQQTEKQLRDCADDLAVAEKKSRD
jgi:hypothetical protein